MPVVESDDAAPLVCTLSAGDVAVRLTRIEQLSRTHLHAHCLQGSTLRLFYASDAAAELAAIVALERECCAFLTFQLAESEDNVELLISVQTSQATDVWWLFSHFLADAPALPPQGPGACGCAKG